MLHTNAMKAVCGNTDDRHVLLLSWSRVITEDTCDRPLLDSGEERFVGHKAIKVLRFGTVVF